MAQREAESSGLVEGPNGERVAVRFYPDGAIRISVTKAAGYDIDDVRLGKREGQPTNITLTPKT
ncbi:MAG: hypothetical protein H0W90_08130 [Actinobacteria bacterium]|nr:hypothetical protein [Actinomycetota bacterium]